MMLRLKDVHVQLIMIINDIANIVSNGLQLYFNYSGYSYVLTSWGLREHIRNEIISILSGLSLTSTQLDILFNSDDQSLEQFKMNIVGDFKYKTPCNHWTIMTGDDFECTGLTKVYFDCLNVKLGVYLLDTLGPNDSVLGMLLNPKTHKIKLNRWDGDFRYSATTDTLKHDFAWREKEIISLFCAKLAELGDYKHKEQLKKELTYKNNQPLNKMRTPPNSIQAWWYGSAGMDTASFKFYYNSVLDLFSKTYPYWNLIAPALFGYRFDDVSQYIYGLGLFSSSEKKWLAQGLPLVQKASASLAAEYKNEQEETIVKLRK